VLAAATAVINRGDDAFNRHDAAAMIALLDDDYVGSGVRTGSLTEGRAAAEAALTAAYAHEADVEAFATRKSLSMHADADGDAVWFVAEYDLEHHADKGGPTAHEPRRETGVLRRRGNAYRFAMLDASAPRPGPESLPAPPTLPENTATELFDSFGRPHDGVRQGWGFSTILRHGGHTILFDGGDSADVLASNARALGVDLREVDIAVLSHDHTDHSAGIDYLLSVNPAVKLYAPAEPGLGDVGQAVAVDPPSEKLPPLPTEQVYADGKKEVPRHSTGRYWHADVDQTRAIAPGVALVATESPFLGTYSKYPSPSHRPSERPLRELSLALASESGLIVVVGCSHSGVESIVKEARAKTGRDVALLLGGFHLLPYPVEDIRALAKRLHDQQHVARVAPAHCTGNRGFQVFREVYGDDYVFAASESASPCRSERGSVGACDGVTV
jgi:7,8-dihydropterin-6-yl-methyl-4-(beta-D-ribofuranosyl)aminobenzene 5'-phosphate synthase